MVDALTQGSPTGLSRRWVLGLILGVVAAVVAFALAEEIGRHLGGEVGVWIGWQLVFLVVLAGCIVVARRFVGHRFIPAMCGLFVALSASGKGEQVGRSMGGDVGARVGNSGTLLVIFALWWLLMYLIGRRWKSSKG